MKHTLQNKRDRHESVDADDVNGLIDEIIAEFCEGRYTIGIEGILELADVWKTSGAPVQSFLEVCQFIENEAVGFTGNELIRTHIKMALVDHKRERGIIH